MNRIRINFCRSATVRFALCVLALGLGARAFAGRNIYVATNGSHNSPFITWPDAATNIQIAVNVATNSDTVVLSNGTYYLTNHVSISSNITVRSINTNPAEVFVNGNGATNCFYLTASSVTLAGLTITNGYAYNGGGVFVSNGGVISNCVIVSNTATTYGGGVYVDAASTGLTQIIASSILGNYCGDRGAGIYFASATLITNCTIAGNSANKRGGGMVFNHTNSLVVNCTISRNYAPDYAGGVYLMTTSPTSLLNCVVSANSCPSSTGGGMWIVGGYAGHAAVRNCLIVKNVAGAGAGIFLQSAADIESCTIASNRASGGSKIGGLGKNGAGLVINCVIASNYSDIADRADLYLYSDPYTNDFYNCCVSVNPEKPLNLANGTIIANPQFENLSAGNYRPKVDSPCINAGTNQAWMGGATDLEDGHRRIDGFFERTDIGCYEYRWKGTLCVVK